jgi:hypothetical protein
LQNKVLELVADCNTPLYLSGGTALSRFYLHHRYSDGLDFFVNRDPNFAKYVTDIIERLKENFAVNQALFDTDFARIYVSEDETELKIEFINDVAFHFGDYVYHGRTRTDHPLNILSNKITALPRNAAKDYADILFLAQSFSFNWIELFEAAKEKDLWVNEVSVANLFDQFDLRSLESVQWIEAFNPDVYMDCFSIMAKDILRGLDNSLFGKKF